MWECNVSHLQPNNVIIPLPAYCTTTKRWEDITIFCYFIDSISTDGEVMNYLKSSEAYHYFHNNKCRCCVLKEVGQNLTDLNADKEPRQSYSSFCSRRQR